MKRGDAVWKSKNFNSMRREPKIWVHIIHNPLPVIKGVIRIQP